MLWSRIYFYTRSFKMIPSLAQNVNKVTYVINFSLNFPQTQWPQLIEWRSENRPDLECMLLSFKGNICQILWVTIVDVLSHFNIAIIQFLRSVVQTMSIGWVELRGRKSLFLMRAPLRALHALLISRSRYLQFEGIIMWEQL